MGKGGEGEVFKFEKRGLRGKVKPGRDLGGTKRENNRLCAASSYLVL